MAQMIFSNLSVYARLLAAGFHHEEETESLGTPSNWRRVSIHSSTLFHNFNTLGVLAGLYIGLS
jgi:hypothetical protein